jgi:hypothetical protein
MRMLTGEYQVNCQADFDAIIEEVSGNQWQFIDSVRSVSFGYLVGGYQMDDDDDYLETNNCKSIEMHGGAFIDFNAGAGYLKVNTDHCYLRNVDIQGNGSTGAVTHSFLLEANYVTFDNCKTSNRASNTVFYCFRGSATVLHNRTSKYMNCSVYDIQAAGNLVIFDKCHNISNLLIYDINTDGINCFNNCYNVNNVYIYDISVTGTGYNLYVLSSCTGVSNIYCYDMSIAGGDASFVAVNTGNNISNVLIYQATNYGSGDVYAFRLVDQLVSCSCDQISANSGDAWGCYQCNYIAAIKVGSVASSSGNAYGFDGCTYGAAIYTAEPVNPNNDFIDTVDTDITNKVSTPSVWT